MVAPWHLARATSSSLIVRRKAQPPSNAKKLRQNFSLTEEELKLAFALPHKVAYVPYVKAF